VTHNHLTSESENSGNKTKNNKELGMKRMEVEVNEDE
jgi:hypothetical protein